jgi:hypothetical protein
MPEAHSLQTDKRPSKKADRVRKMAATLFAELFYKQVMAEREQKRRQARADKLDSRSQKDLK